MNYRALERVAFRTVLLVAVLILAALAFRALATLAVAVLATVLIAILLDTAAQPAPLLTGVLRLFPPERREHATFVMGRLREAWVGWMEGVAVNMLVTGVLVYAGLSLIGLDYALVFAVLSGVFVLIPYYGAFIAGIP